MIEYLKERSHSIWRRKYNMSVPHNETSIFIYEFSICVLLIFRAANNLISLLTENVQNYKMNQLM